MPKLIIIFCQRKDPIIKVEAIKEKGKQEICIHTIYFINFTEMDSFIFIPNFMQSEFFFRIKKNNM
jgi:hypothetical protein